MEQLNFSLRLWGITELAFIGISLVLSACSLLPPMLMPALAGGLVALCIFTALFFATLHFSRQPQYTLLLLCAAIFISCFGTLYLFGYLLNGHVKLWSSTSGYYKATLLAAVCGIVTLILQQRTLRRIQHNYLYYCTHRQ